MTDAVENIEAKIRIRGNYLTIKLDPKTLNLSIYSDSDECAISLQKADLMVIVRVVKVMQKQAKEIAALTEYGDE